MQSLWGRPAEWHGWQVRDPVPDLVNRLQTVLSPWWWWDHSSVIFSTELKIPLRTPIGQALRRYSQSFLGRWKRFFCGLKTWWNSTCGSLSILLADTVFRQKGISIEDQAELTFENWGLARMDAVSPFFPFRLREIMFDLDLSYHYLVAAGRDTSCLVAVKELWQAGNLLLGVWDDGRPIIYARCQPVPSPQCIPVASSDLSLCDPRKFN